MKKALITGASSGIGKEFAIQLSKKGYHTVLVARRKEKLEEVANELEKNYPTKSEILVSDLSKQEGMEEVENYIKKLDGLDMLINNAGFGIPRKFQDIPLEKSLDMINLHVTTPTRLCYAAIPKMSKQGVIINVSSLASLIPKAGSSVYAATKSYLTMFSKTLQKDLRDKIKIQALCPGFTHTGFHDTEEFKNWGANIPKLLWTNAEYVVEKSLKDLKKDKVVCIPEFHNHILLSLMNNKLISPILWKFYGKND